MFFSPASRLRLSVSACSGIMCTLKDLDSSSSFEEMSQLPSKALDWFHAPSISIPIRQALHHRDVYSHYMITTVLNRLSKIKIVRK